MVTRAEWSAPVVPSAMRILWLANLDPRYGFEHGAHLRIFPHARRLATEGHAVYLGVARRPSDVPAQKLRYLDSLVDAGIAADYFEIDYRPPRSAARMAQLLVYPPFQNRLLAGSTAIATDQILTFMREQKVDVCIFNGSALLFALPAVSRVAPAVVDWPDSMTLSFVRELRLRVRAGAARRAADALRHLALAAATERYYGRLATLNVVASPVDKRYLDRLTGEPWKTHALMNGVDQYSGARPDRLRNRIIFTGNMDFPPNYESAIWFIDRVLPLLLVHKPDIQFVVAGANPVPELLARVGFNVEITGFVPDLGSEIARSSLYVAPLICGGGFKNKIVEALASGTFVVATSIATEFLDAEIRGRMAIADDPSALAHAILEHLERPARHAKDLAVLQRVVEDEFTWEKSTETLLALCDGARGATLRSARRPEVTDVVV
jgi:glycosyltransferase involved in cell wall biosynthesis